MANLNAEVRIVCPSVASSDLLGVSMKHKKRDYTMNHLNESFKVSAQSVRM